MVRLLLSTKQPHGATNSMGSESRCEETNTPYGAAVWYPAAPVELCSKRLSAGKEPDDTGGFQSEHNYPE